VIPPSCYSVCPLRVRRSEDYEADRGRDRPYQQFLYPPLANLLTHKRRRQTNIHPSIGNESVPIQLTQCWFSRQAISNAKTNIYFSNKIYGNNFYQTTLGNCYGLKLAKSRLQFKKFVLFIIIFGTISFLIGRWQTSSYRFTVEAHLSVVESTV